MHLNKKTNNLHRKKKKNRKLQPQVHNHMHMSISLYYILTYNIFPLKTPHTYPVPHFKTSIPLSFHFSQHFPNLSTPEQSSTSTTTTMLQTCSVCVIVSVILFAIAGAEDPYRFFTWNVTYGDIYPLGVRQQVRSSTDLDLFSVVDPVW